MSLSFKYRRELFKGKPAYFPKIPVLLFNKGHSFQTSALLDSGATDIFIPVEIAELLELDLGEWSWAESWQGKFKIWESRIGIAVGKGSQTFRTTLPCNVAKKTINEEEIIFGRTFFKHFEITFNELERKTTLKRLAGKPF